MLPDAWKCADLLCYVSTHLSGGVDIGDWDAKATQLLRRGCKLFDGSPD